MVTAGARVVHRVLAALRRDLAGFRAAVHRQPPIRRGLHTFVVHPPGGVRRLHLRVEGDGRGVLLVDVTDAVHLNATAAALVYHALSGMAEDGAVALLRRHRGAPPDDEVRRQVAAVYRLVHHLRTTTDACPTCGLDELARSPLFSLPVRAPYKADLALTYACNNACGHCYNPAGRSGMASLAVEGWRRVLEKLAELGVPHVIFTGGEPTLFDGLVDLAAYAAARGMVAGMNTNGRRLAERHFANTLYDAGLDHVQITLQSHDRAIHNAVSRAGSFDETVAGIANSLAAGLHTITNTTLSRRNLATIEPTVDFLAELGLRTFAVNGMIHSGHGRGNPDALTPEELAPVLVGLRDRAEQHGMRMLWYTPTPYCRLSPVELELGARRCNAGEYSICIEPNGDVLPCQSYYRPAGNFLRDDWSTIFDGPLLRSFRDRVTDPKGCGLPEPCWDCPDLQLCGGGCRLEWEGGVISDK